MILTPASLSDFELPDSRHRIAAAQEVAAFAADGFDFDVLAGFQFQKAHRRFEDVGVESSRQALVAGDHDQQDVVFGALRQQGMAWLACLRIVNFGAGHQRLQNIRQHLGVRTRRQGAFLRPPQLRRRDHLHGLGDLPRVGHAADAAPDIENVRHGGDRLRLSPRS